MPKILLHDSIIYSGSLYMAGSVLDVPAEEAEMLKSFGEVEADEKKAEQPTPPKQAPKSTRSKK